MISLEKSINVAKVDTTRAQQLQSDRFLNSSKALCYNWTGLDITGREVNDFSFMHKAAGCNLPSDRVVVENDLRPKYYNYVNLSSYGLQNPNNDSPADIIPRSGDFGLGLQANVKGFGKDKIEI